MKMEDLDGFFLTAGLATPALRAKVEGFRDQIFAMEREFESERIKLIGVESDLRQMEQKALFVENELERTLAILSPPAEGEMEKVYDILEQYVHDPLNYVSTGAMGVGSLVFLTGKLGSWATGTKTGVGGAVKRIKPGTKLGRSVAGARKASGVIGKAGKLGKWAKFTKVGSKLGALGLVIAAIDFGLALATAKEMNAHFKAQAAAMKKNIAEGRKAIDELKDQVLDGQATVKSILAQSGVDTVKAFTDQLNESIADLGEKSANASTARRMLLDGYMPPDRILMYVPTLAPEVLDELQLKIDAERQLAEGSDPKQVATETGLTFTKVDIIARLQKARVALLRGDTIAEAASAANVSENLTAGEDATLEGDLQSLWSQIDARVEPSTIAGMILVPTAAVEQLYAQLDAKTRLFAGESVPDVSSALGQQLDAIEGWRDDLDVAKASIEAAAGAKSARFRPVDLAADHLVPLAIVNETMAQAA